MLVSAILAVVVVTSMTAWEAVSGDTDRSGPRLQRVVPTDTTPALIANDGKPNGTLIGEGRFFTMYVPANFRIASTRMPNGEQMTIIDAPSSKPATPVRLMVVPDTRPKGTATQQSDTLKVKKQAEGVKDFTRSTVYWPGAQSAILLQWTGAGAKDNGQRTWKLMAQVNDHLIVNLDAVAPAAQFDKAGLVRIMESFRPHA
jgi:hypothetical protein